MSKSGLKIQIDKVLSIAAFALIASALCIIAITPPASGFELSIYNAYPVYFWFFIIASIACGVGILLHQAFAQEKSNWWLAGLVIIIFSNTIFLLLPEFRGYAFFGWGDTPSHLGIIRDILNTEHIGERLHYPAEHILGTGLIQVAGVSLENIPSLFSVLFSGIYIVNMGLLAKAAGNRPGQVFLIVAFASPLIYSLFHVNMHPSILALFMIPCLLYFYHKREQLPHSKLRNTALIFLLAFSIVLFHPMTTLFAIVVFLAFGLAHALYSRFLIRETFQTEQYGNPGKNFFRISLGIFIAFFIWYFRYPYTLQSVKSIFDWLVYEIGTPVVETQMEGLAVAGLTLLQTIELFTNQYGAIFFLFLISGTALVSVLKRCLSRGFNPRPIEFVYAIQFLIALFIGTAMMLGDFVEHEPVRVIRLSLAMGTIVSALVIYNTARKETPTARLALIIATGIVIIAMVSLSMGSVYGSPRTCRANAQVTWMEIAYTKWLQSSKSPDIPVVVNLTQYIRRFEDYNFGREYSPITRIKIDPERLPSHFGYEQNDSIAEALGFQDRYVAVSEIDKVAPMIYPENVRPKCYQWTEEDFAKLGSDSAAAKLYENGEFEVWRVYGK